MFCPFVLEILSRNEILTSVKGHNSVTNVPKMMHNNPNVDLVNINAYIEFGEILSICSQDIEQKQIMMGTEGWNDGQPKPSIDPFFKAGL